MAIRDDLAAFGMTHECAHLSCAHAFEKSIEREVRRARDVALARVAVGARSALELERGPDVEEDEVVLAQSTPELVEGYLVH